LFFKKNEGEGKKHKNDGFVLSFSCLRGVRIRGGKEDNDHKQSSSSIFRKSVKDQEKNMKMTILCHHLRV
jgi:hypothetical protein